MDYEIRRPSPTRCVISFKVDPNAANRQQEAEKSLNAILADEKIRPLSTPLLSQDEENEPGFTCVFDVLPPISLPEDLSKLELRMPVDKNAHILQDTVNRFLRQHASLEKKDGSRKPEVGDVVLLDISALYDGRPVPGMNGEDALLKINGDDELPDILKAALKLRPGECDTFAKICPNDYPNPLLRGKTLNCKVCLKEIYTEKPAKFDENLAKKLGFSKLRQLKQALYEYALNEEMLRLQTEARRELLASIINKLDFPVPESLARRALAERMAELKYFLLDVNDKNEHEDIFKQAGEEMLAQAMEEARVETFLLALAFREHMHVSPTELDSEIARLAGEWKMEPDALRTEMEQNGALNDLEEIILARKALSFLARQATVRPYVMEEGAKEK